MPNINAARERRHTDLRIENAARVADELGFLDGIIVALGCLHLGFNEGPGSPRYDEILNAAGKDRVLARVATMDRESRGHSGLAVLLERKRRAERQRARTAARRAHG